MKTLMSVCFAVFASVVVFADTIDEQVLYWQITDKSLSGIEGASYCVLYAQANGETVCTDYGATETGVISESPYTTMTVGVNEEGKDVNWWSKVKVSDVSFYFELYSDVNALLGTSETVSYAKLYENMYTHFADPGRNPDVSKGNYVPTFTAAVPEPTSGLLVLIGIAGLALRRRRA